MVSPRVYGQSMNQSLTGALYELPLTNILIYNIIFVKTTYNYQIVEYTYGVVCCKSALVVGSGGKFISFDF